jgi:hypothetical protein
VGNKKVTIDVDMKTTEESSLSVIKNTKTGELTYNIKISPWQTEVGYQLNPNDPWIPAHEGNPNYPITMNRLIVHEIFHILNQGQNSEKKVDESTNDFMEKYFGEPKEG